MDEFNASCRHDQVGVVPLGADERLGVALAAVELAEHLAG